MEVQKKSLYLASIVYLFFLCIGKNKRGEYFSREAWLPKAFLWKEWKVLLLDSRTLKPVPGTCQYHGWARRNVSILMFKIIHYFNQESNCRH